MNRTLLAFLILASSTSAARRPLEPDDLWNWRHVSDPRIRPDGEWVVFVEGWSERAPDAACANLWAASTDGKRRARLSDGAWRDSRPRWSPKGDAIAYVSSRDGRPRIRIRQFESGEETQVGLDQAPLELAWSPDGNWIAFTAPLPEDGAPAAWAPPAILPRLRRRDPPVGLFVTAARGGTSRQLAGGAFDWRGEPAWLPDGQTVLAAARDGAIYAVRVADGSARRLTPLPGRNENPVPSPDGKRIAWLSTDARPQSYAVRKLSVMNADGSRAMALSGSLDRDAAAPQWSSDSRTVYFLADDRGSTHVYAARHDGTVRQVTSAAERLQGFSLADSGLAVSVRSTAADPGAVATLSVYSPDQRATLTAPNEKWLSEREPGAVEEIHYDSAGRSIQAWLVKPPGFDASKKYPLLLDIRDNPRRMYGVEFKLRAQIIAARGYLVLCANPRGTPGYGEAFGNLLRTRYPGDDFDDLLRGVEFVAAKPYVDAKRLMVSGGLVAAWAIGHTDRFAAAVARRPIADWVTDVAVSPDGARRANEWMGAMPWDDPEQYVTHSPIFFARSFKTPTLVLAGERDAESEQLYFALQARGVETALVRMPQALRPSDCVLELQTVLAWLARW